MRSLIGDIEGHSPKSADQWRRDGRRRAPRPPRLVPIEEHGYRLLTAHLLATEPTRDRRQITPRLRPAQQRPGQQRDPAGAADLQPVPS